jgi:uncharacterized membrane protein SpoIIM required for sporulation
VSGFDTARFVDERSASWQELEHLLAQADRRGTRSLGVEGARRLGKLYRSVAGDLVRARGELVDAAITDHLNDLVARSYAVVYAEERGSRVGDLLRFFFAGYPALVRSEGRAVALSAALLFGGAFLGAVAHAIDPDARTVLVPEQHAEMTPEERIARDEGEVHSTGQAAQFSSFLFTHNIQVTFLVFAAGITAGVGTASLLFANGVPLGALAWEYHASGHGLFFWAWILPHGVPELTAIVVAGAAGFVLARGLLAPGRRRRRDALVVEARRAARLVVGTMPVLVLAGLIEGTISQMHAPLMPYWAKLAFAAIVGLGLYAWLLRAGTAADAREDA